MRLHDDLRVRTLVHAGTMDWAASPAAGVERRMLFRIGDEKARATSIVRYAPGSRFARHVHAGGEEFLVLNGVFQDETGDFPAGSYVRNPPGTAHEPGSAPGCTILVKLWQFDAHDRARVVRRPKEGDALSLRPGVESSVLLFEGAGELVVAEDWQAGAEVRIDNPHGLEVFVVDGGFAEGGNTLTRWSWLRLPAGTPIRAHAGPGGARVWYKAAPLLHANVVAFDDGRT